MTTDNIIKLATLQENAELPPAAEEAIALVFAARYAGEWRYVAGWGQWMNFTGTYWCHDYTLHAFDLARTVCREMALEGDKPSGAVASAKTVAAVERLAKADRRLAATTEQWDSSEWLLNVGE
jgi:hypothetical protein